MVTVLFADLADSTGLTTRLDPERAREVLGAFYAAASEELRSLRGRAEKFVGDKEADKLLTREYRKGFEISDKT